MCERLYADLYADATSRGRAMAIFMAATTYGYVPSTSSMMHFANFPQISRRSSSERLPSALWLEMALLVRPHLHRGHFDTSMLPPGDIRAYNPLETSKKDAQSGSHVQQMGRHRPGEQRSPRDDPRHPNTTIPHVLLRSHCSLQLSVFGVDIRGFVYVLPSLCYYLPR